MRENNLILRLIGVAMAISGAVIVIHAVPVFVWYIILIILILIFAYLMLNT